MGFACVSWVFSPGKISHGSSLSSLTLFKATFSLRSFIIAFTFKFTLVKPRIHVFVVIRLFKNVCMLLNTDCLEKKHHFASTGMDWHNRWFYKQHISQARPCEAVQQDYTSRTARVGSPLLEFCFISCAKPCFEKYQWVRLSSTWVIKWALQCRENKTVRYMFYIWLFMIVK